MSVSRKGLLRRGLRAYEVSGKAGTIVISKESPRDWRIRPVSMHNAFYFERYKLLRDARKSAEAIVRGKREWDAILDLPHFMDRRKG